MTYHHISSLTYHILRLNIHPSSFTRWMITLLIHCRGPVGHDSQSVLAASARACREEPGFQFGVTGVIVSCEVLFLTSKRHVC
jgi:hypothetical protein